MSDCASYSNQEKLLLILSMAKYLRKGSKLSSHCDHSYTGGKNQVSLSDDLLKTEKQETSSQTAKDHDEA